MVDKGHMKELRKRGYQIFPRSAIVTEKYIVEEVYKESRFLYLLYDRKAKEIKYTAAFLVGGEIAYIPVEDLDAVEHHQFFLPEEPVEYGNTEELRKEILEFIPHWVDYDAKFVELDSSYILLSWLFDRLYVLPYRRALGEVGSGKSRWAEAVGELCRLGFKQGATATAAGVYRKCHIYRGTQILDENEFGTVFSDVFRAITLVLNAGYSATQGMVTRCVGGMHVPKAFYCYGPKLIAARTRFGDIATESRTITHRSYKSNEVPKEYSKDFFTTAQKLRNKLLKWRLDHYDTPLTQRDQFMKGAIEHRIDPRLLEVTMPLTRFIPPKDTEMFRTLRDILLESNEMLRADRESSMEAACLRGLLTIMERGEPLTMGRISVHLAENEEETAPFAWTARRVSMILRRRLDLQVRQQYNRIDNNRLSTFVWSQRNNEVLLKRLEEFEMNDQENLRIVDTYTLP